MKKIVKVRMEKEYAEAHNHVAIGEVLEEKDQYLRLRCRTYHFGKYKSGRNIKTEEIPISVDHASVMMRYKSGRNIKTGEVRVRCFPWERIAVITELSQDTEWEKASFKLNKEGNLVLDDSQETRIEDEIDSL